MRKKKHIPLQIFTYLFLLVMIVIAVFPAVWMLSTAIKQTTELYDMPPKTLYRYWAPAK